MPPRFDAVFFDLDETLIPDDSVRDAALVETCREAGGVSPESLAKRVLEEARRLWGEFHAERRYAQRIGTSSWEGLWMRIEGEQGDPDLRALRAFLPDYRARAWGGALEKCGAQIPSGLAGKLAERFMEIRRRAEFCSPFPESRCVLKSLHGKYKLGLITNGVSGLQREKLALSGLGGYFDAVLVSGEVGVGKPEAGIFLEAARALGVPPERAAMAGDKLERDVAGAAGVGMASVWVNRKNEIFSDAGDAPPSPAPPRPDAEFPDLRPLPAWLFGARR